MRLAGRYPKPLHLVEKIEDKAAASDSASRTAELFITNFHSDLLFQSEKQNVPLFMKATSPCTRDYTQEKNSRAIQPSWLLSAYCGASEQAENRLQRAVSNRESMFVEVLLAEEVH